MSCNFVLLLFSFILLSPLKLLYLPLLTQLHPLCLLSLRILNILKVLLLFLHDPQLFLLEHLHPRSFQRLPTQYTKDRLDILIKDKELIIFHTGLGVPSSFGGDGVGGGWAIDQEVGLGTYFVLGGFVGQLVHELVGLDVDVLTTGEGVGGFYVAGEEFVCWLHLYKN